MACGGTYLGECCESKASDIYIYSERSQRGFIRVDQSSAVPYRWQLWTDMRNNMTWSYNGFSGYIRIHHYFDENGNFVFGPTEQSGNFNDIAFSFRSVFTEHFADYGIARGYTDLDCSGDVVWTQEVFLSGSLPYLPDLVTDDVNSNPGESTGQVIVRPLLGAETIGGSSSTVVLQDHPYVDAKGTSCGTPADRVGANTVFISAAAWRTILGPRDKWAILKSIRDPRGPTGQIEEGCSTSYMDEGLDIFAPRLDPDNTSRAISYEVVDSIVADPCL